jgi:hypothetical protein
MFIDSRANSVQKVEIHNVMSVNYAEKAATRRMDLT